MAQKKLVRLGGFGLGTWTHGLKDAPEITRSPQEVSASVAGELQKAADNAGIPLVIEDANAGSSASSGANAGANAGASTEAERGDS